jgi:hypothetical protein
LVLNHTGAGVVSGQPQSRLPRNLSAREGDESIARREDYWIIVREVVNRWEEIKRLATSGKRPFGWVVESRRKQWRRL